MVRPGLESYENSGCFCLIVIQISAGIGSEKVYSYDHSN